MNIILMLILNSIQILDDSTQKLFISTLLSEFRMGICVIRYIEFLQVLCIFMYSQIIELQRSSVESCTWVYRTKYTTLLKKNSCFSTCLATSGSEQIKSLCNVMFNFLHGLFLVFLLMLPSMMLLNPSIITLLLKTKKIIFIYFLKRNIKAKQCYGILTDKGVVCPIA